MHPRPRRAALLAPAALLSLALSMPLAAQSDGFESGTTEGWFAGGGPLGGVPPQPPTQVPDGGPGGVGDGYLLVTASGSAGPGGRLVAMNASQWARNYLDDGIIGISMQVRNFGSTDVFLRLLFENPIPGPPTDIAVTAGFAVPGMSGWMPLFFSIRPGDLTAIAGDVNTALATTTILRLYHSTDPVFPATPFAAQIGVDDITATTIPEPATVLMFGTGLAMLAGVTRRRRTR